MIGTSAAMENDLAGEAFNPAKAIDKKQRFRFREILPHACKLRHLKIFSIALAIVRNPIDHGSINPCERRICG